MSERFGQHVRARSESDGFPSCAMHRSLTPPALIVFLLSAVTSVFAAEIYSNGTGGGNWDDAATWRGGAVPGPEDIAVVAREDEVLFARDDSQKVTCRELHLDPRGVLRFKPRAGRVIMQVAGEVLSYGIIRLDGAQSEQDVIGLHLVADKPDARKITIKDQGLLIATGHSSLAVDKLNVTLRAGEPLTDKNQSGGDGGVLAIGNGCGLDVRYAHVDNVRLQASNIDNTGAEFNERLVIQHNRFTRDACVVLYSCDTPTITNNLFRKPEGGWVQPAAIYVHGCPLAEIRDNDMQGMYYHGIQGYHSADVAVIRNVIDKAYIGFQWYAGSVMVQALVIRNARHGVNISHGGGAIDGLLTSQCQFPLIKGVGVLQMSNWADDGVKAKRVVTVQHGRLDLLNCNIAAEDLEIDPKAELPEGETAGPLVRCRYFLVASVEGEVPPGAVVAVQSKGWTPARPGAQDPNVTNSPASLALMKLTPLPGTMQSLLVTAWQYDTDRNLVAAPTYQVQLLKTDGDGKPIATAEATPDDTWFRAAPNEPKATVELRP